MPGEHDVPRTAAEAKEAMNVSGPSPELERGRLEAIENTKKAQLLSRVRNDFRYHPPTPEQVEVYAEIRDRALSFAEYLVVVSPPSRELSTALTKLEECVMAANAGIARNGGS